eukprot:Pgem_evm1s12076
MLSAEERLNFFEMISLIQKRKITHLFLPFVALNEFCEISASTGEFFEHLTEIRTAGEQLHISSKLNTFFQSHLHCSLYNDYGPAETFIATSYSCPRSLSGISKFLNGVSNCTMDVSGVILKSVGALSRSLSSDFHLEIGDDAQDILLNFIYRERLYKQKQIQRFSSHYLELLKSLLLKPNEIVAKSTILNAKEQQQLVAWGKGLTTITEQNPLVNVADLFRASSVKWGTKIAVEDKHNSLTYKELDEKSDSYANFLIDKYKIFDGECVGVCLPRCCDLLLWMVAILKSGGCMVLLDPAFPQ